jgi:hypothetical protein
MKFEGFSDIVFNPKRSLNCQARAAALFVSLSQNELLNEQILQDKECYLRLLSSEKPILPIPQTQPDRFPISKALSQAK